MTSDQPAQIDCRDGSCKFYGGAGKCTNISPAITLYGIDYGSKCTTGAHYKCWSKEPIKPTFPPDRVEPGEQSRHDFIDTSTPIRYGSKVGKVGSDMLLLISVLFILEIIILIIYSQCK